MTAMAKVLAGMSVSLDGFVADRNGSPERLSPDLADLQGVVRGPSPVGRC